MPQLDPTFYAAQVFWLVLTIVPLYFILRRAVLPRISEVLGARQRHIDADLEKAGGLRQEAEKVMAEYEAALAEARAQAGAAIKRAGDEMAGESAQRHETFGQELAVKTRAAEARIAAAKDEALAQVAVVAAEVAAAAVVKLIGAQIPAAEVGGAVKDAMGGGA